MGRTPGDLRRGVWEVVFWGAVALLPVGLWLWMDVVDTHPYWLVRGDSEQDMAYTAWAWWRYGVMDDRHPGVPVFLIHGWLFGLLGGKFESIPAFLFWSHGLVALTRSLTIFLWAWWARQRASLGWVLIALMVWMSHPTFLSFAEVINTDSYLPVLGLWLLTLAWITLDEPNLLKVSLLGIGSGLLLAVKFSTLPLVLAIAVSLVIKAMRSSWWYVLAYGLLGGGSFVFFGTYPQISIKKAFDLAYFFLHRPDSGWYIYSARQFYYVWKHVLTLRDFYWLGSVLMMGGFWAWWIWTIARERTILREEFPRHLLFALSLAALIYTLGAQAKEDIPHLRYVLSLGYRIRNTYPPTLVLPLLVLWIGQGERIRCVFRWRLLLVYGIVAGLLAWGGFLVERRKVYPWMWSLHVQTQSMLDRYTGPGRIAFWTTKGFPIVGEAAFHWEGNYQPGKGLFSLELLTRFPRYTLFNLRAIPRVLEQIGPPPQEPTPEACTSLQRKAGRESLDGSLFESDREFPLLPGFDEGMPPRWVVFWTWEAKHQWGITDLDLWWALCAYGYPQEIGRIQYNNMEWVVFLMKYNSEGILR